MSVINDVINDFFEHKEKMKELDNYKEKIKENGQTQRTAIEETGKTIRGALGSKEKDE